MKHISHIAYQLAKQFMAARMPIPLSASEERLSGSDSSIRIFPYTKLRMVRPGIARAIVEDGHVVVYHCMENSR